MKQIFALLLLSTLSFAQLPENKYSTDNGQKHKERSRGVTVSIGYPVMSQFLNATFVSAKEAGQMKANHGFSIYVDVPVKYPFSVQVGGYRGSFLPADGLTFGNGAVGKDVEVSHELFEAFVCSKLLPNKTPILPYIGIGYIDGGLKLGKRDDTSKDRVIMSAIKIQSPAWRVGLTAHLGKIQNDIQIGLMIDYTQPFQIEGLLPNTFYASNRLQVGLSIYYN